MDFVFLGTPSQSPRRRGRPPVAEPRSSVSTWIPAREHDQLVRLAKDRRVSVSEVLRDLVRREVMAR